LVSKFIRGAVLAGAVTASIAATGSVASAAAPAANATTAQAQAKSQVYIVCDGIDAVIGCQYPSYLNYPFAGQFYTGGDYFAFEQPWFGGWWGDNGYRWHHRYPGWGGWYHHGWRHHHHDGGWGDDDD
jgi:hypothetical protein